MCTRVAASLTEGFVSVGEVAEESTPGGEIRRTPSQVVVIHPPLCVQRPLGVPEACFDRYGFSADALGPGFFSPPDPRDQTRAREPLLIILRHSNLTPC